MVVSRARRTVRVKVADDRVAVAACRYGSGERSGEAHMHAAHANAFYVLDGELTFELGREQRRVVASGGTLVLVPQRVAHAFENAGGTAARFLDLHAPGAGFGSDHLPAPPDGGRSAADVVVRHAGEGESFVLGAATLRVKAGGGDGDGTLTIMEVTVAPDRPGPKLHRHPAMVDGFYVLAGRASLITAEATIEAWPGCYAFVPAGLAHALGNAGREPARVLTVMAPGGFEASLKEATDRLATAGSDPEVVADHLSSRLGPAYVVD